MLTAIGISFGMTAVLVLVALGACLGSNSDAVEMGADETEPDTDPGPDPAPPIAPDPEAGAQELRQ